MAKFYAVKKGRKEGIFTTWDECKEQIYKYPNAVYKSFLNLKDAENYLYDNVIDNNSDNLIDDIDAMTAYVDGSFNVKTSIYGYGAVIIYNGNKISLSESYDNAIYANARNVAGEVFGAMAAVNVALEKKCKNLNIYYDYAGIENWALGAWNANQELSKKYAEFMKISMKQINIKFIKVKAHSGNTLNDEADKLAKSAVGL